MSDLRLTFAIGDYLHMRELTLGRIKPEGIDLTVLTLPLETIAYRFLAEDIQCDSRQAILLEGVKQCLFVNQAAARTVDETRSRFEQTQFVGADEAACAVGERGMQCHKIGLLESAHFS